MFLDRKRELCLLSSGIPHLDHILGSSHGLPMGSVMLMYEDTFTKYAKHMSRYFLSQGRLDGHDVCIMSSKNNQEIQEKIIEKCPKAVEDNPQQQKVAETAEKMNIAWRYNPQPQIRTKSNGGAFTTAENGVNLFPNGASDVFTIHNIHELEDLVGSRYTATTGNHKNPLRVLIEYDNKDESFNSNELQESLLHLRELARGSFVVIMIIFPAWLYGESTMAEHLVDAAVAIDSFSSDYYLATDKSLREYQGFVRVKKPLRLHSLTGIEVGTEQSGTTKYGFKCLKRDVNIEKIHFIPDA